MTKLAEQCEQVEQEQQQPDEEGGGDAQQAEPTWDEMVAETTAQVEEHGVPDDYDPDGGDDDDGETGAPAAAAPGKPKPQVIERKKWEDLEKPAPSKIAMHERLARKQGAQEAATEAQRLRSELEAERAKSAQYTSKQQEAAAKFKELYEAGDVDAALKVFGVPGTLGDLQRKLIETKTGKQLNGRDPRVEELQGTINQLLERDRRAEQERAKQQQEQAELAQMQEDLGYLAEEIKSLPYEGADALLELPGFDEMVYADMRRANGQLPTEAAVKQQRNEWQKLFNTMYAAAEKGALSFPGKQPAASKPGAPARPINPVPRGGHKGRVYSQKELDAMPDDERWQLIKTGAV